jgi:excisionase family DNA binding protein
MAETVELLSTVQAAEIANVSRPTVWRLVRDGALPAIRVGHQVRIRRDDLDAYLYGDPTPLKEN